MNKLCDIISLYGSRISGWVLAIGVIPWMLIFFEKFHGRFVKGDLLDMHPHSMVFYFPQTPSQMFAYVATAAVMFMAAVIVYALPGGVLICEHRRTMSRSGWFGIVRGVSRVALVTIGIVSGLLSLFFYAATDYLDEPSSIRSTLVALEVVYVVWFFRFMLLSAADWIGDGGWRLVRIAGVRFSVVWLISAMASLALVIAIYGGNMVRSPLVLNEYLNIPSTPKSGEGDVFDALRSRSVAVVSPLEDVRAIEVPSSTELMSRVLLREDLLRPAFFDRKTLNYVDMGERVSDFVQLNRRDGFYYDPDKSSVVIRGGVHPDDVEWLKGVLQRDDFVRVNSVIERVNSAYAPGAVPAGSRPDVLASLADIEWRVLGRYMIHHHNFLFGSMHQVELGKDADQVEFQYGKWPTLVMGKVLSMTVGMSWSGYNVLLHAVGLAYSVFVIASSFYIFRDKRVASIFVFGYVVSVALIRHEFLILAPGLSPFRHIFDFPAIVAWIYSIRNKGLLTGRLALSLSAILALLAVASNSTTGLPLAGALVVGQFLAWRERRFNLAGSLAILAGYVLLCLFAHWSSAGNSSLTKYYMGGLLGFQGPRSPVVLMFVAVTVAYAMVAIVRPRVRLDMKILPVVFGCYAQGLMLYYVWGGTRYHLLNYAVIYLSLAGAVLQVIVPCCVGVRISRRILGAAILPAAALLLLSGVYHFDTVSKHREAANYYRVSRWGNSTMDIYTTMPEEPFARTVDFIIENIDDSNGAYLISEYDNLLPLMGDFINEMPYPDLKWYIHSVDDEMSVINYLMSRVPGRIFVDNSIVNFMDTGGSLGSSFGRLDGEMLMNGERIKALARVFDAVRDEYELVGSGGLVSCFERISSAKY